MNNKLILSNYEIDDIAYHIMNGKIIELIITGIRASITKSSGIIHEKVEYASNHKWISSDKLFSTKIEAAKFILEQNGLEISLKEIE